MNFAQILKNDITDFDKGFAVSLWFQGCDVRCPGCHNYQLWDARFERDNDEVVEELCTALTDHGIRHGLSILGGEPLMKENVDDCAYIIRKVRERLPETVIYVWTGHILEQLDRSNPSIAYILDTIDALIDGPFDQNKYTLGLKLRGSSNQRIFRRIDGKLVETNK